MREPDRYLKWFKSESVKQIYRLGIWNVCENEGKTIFSIWWGGNSTETLLDKKRLSTIYNIVK